MDKTKLILPVSILLGCVILGGFYYASVVAQQASVLQASQELAANEASCLQMQQRLLSQQQSQIPSGASMSYSARNHYDTKLGKCMVELDLNTLYPNGTYSDDYQIYDAVENNELFDCTIESDGTSFCLDDRQPEGVQTQITKAQFDALEQQYLNQ